MTMPKKLVAPDIMIEIRIRNQDHEHTFVFPEYMKCRKIEYEGSQDIVLPQTFTGSHIRINDRLVYERADGEYNRDTVMAEAFPIFDPNLDLDPDLDLDPNLYLEPPTPEIP